MAYEKRTLLLLIFWVAIDASYAAPIPNSGIFPSAELSHVLSGPFIIFVSAGFLVACVVLILGCTCCQRKDIQALTNQNQRVLGQLNDNLAALQNGSEFAIFPPASTAINMQPMYSSSLFGNEGDKVIFEPLPDILPKRHINGQNLAQSSKPAQFSMLLRRKSSLHDWFDDPNSNFPRNQLQYLQEIGNGWFGRVVEGEARMIIDGQEKTPVIVKILREEATPSEHLYFLHDIRPYRDLQHPNVLRLLGRCLETDPFLLIMEYSTSNLKTFLINQRENFNKQSSEVNEQLLQIVCGITAGLSRMHENNFTHSDLAARNCFIGMNNVVKVGDYGLSLEMFREEYYCVGDLALPVRWLAPEALNCTERAIETRDPTKESNIWSLGVLFWEILELGQLPYSTLTNEEVLQKVILDRSVQLQEPTFSHPYKMQMHQIMELCWRPSNCRPDVQVIEMLLKQLSRHKESSETFSSFEQRWNALQNKASLTAGNAPMKFENDFISSYSPHSASLFNESISDSSCEPFHEGVQSYRSPSLRGLNGSFDELQPDELTASLKSHLQEQDNISRREAEVVTPEQITEAIRDFDAMLATEALGVDSRSATLERESSSYEKKDSSRMATLTDENANSCSNKNSSSDDFIRSHDEMPVLSEYPEESCAEITESKCNLKEQVPVQDAAASNEVTPPPSKLEDISESDVEKTESSTPLPDILITQSTCCQNPDDAEERTEYVNLCQPAQNYYHFVLKDDLDTDGDLMNSSESNIPPDLVETCEYSMEDSSKSCSSDPVTSTPSKSQEYYSLLNEDSLSSSKIIKDIPLEACATSSSESKSYYESVNTLSSNEDNSVSFKTAATSLTRDSEGNQINSSLEDSGHKGPLVSDENITSISENSFFSATSNVKSDILSKDHSHSEDYYSTLENSPALSEKTISAGNDNQRSFTPDLINIEHTFCVDFESDSIHEKSVDDSVIVPGESDLNANNVIHDQENDESYHQVSLSSQEDENSNHQNLADYLTESLSKQMSLEDSSSAKKNPYSQESNIVPKSSPVSSHSAWNANDTKPDLVNENYASGPGDHVSAESSFIFHKPYLDLQEDSELESSSVVSDSFVFFSNTDNRLNDLDDKCGRVLAWTDHNKVIVSDLSDIDEVDSENSSPDNRKRPPNDNCRPSSLHSNMNMHFEELNQRCNFQNPLEMTLNSIDEYDDNDDDDDEEDQTEADEVLKIDIETNEAILVDRSEALIGFVPSRSIELLQEYECLTSQLDSSGNRRNTYTNSDISDDEAGDISMHMCNGSVTDNVNNISPFLENAECSDDEMLKLDKTGDSTGEEYNRSPVKSRQLPLPPYNDLNSDYTEYPLNEINETENIVQCSDENANVTDLFNDVVLSNQPTKSVIWHSDETLDVLKDEEIGPVIIESEEILAGYNNKNNNLEGNLGSQIQFGSSDFLDRLIVSSASSPNCSAASTPCRDVVYTPDFESESDDSSSSCSSTSGSFECIHNKFKDVTDISMESVQKEDTPLSDKATEMSPLKVFSKTWDCHATPNKSLLKSPEKKVLPIRKSVSFHEDPQLVFQYPPASDSSEDERENDYLRRVDYTSYADWELQVGEDDEIPEEMIEIEELEYEPCSRGRGYRGISSFSGTSLYTLTGFSEEDLETQDIGIPSILSSEGEFDEKEMSNNWRENGRNMGKEILTNEDINAILNGSHVEDKEDSFTLNSYAELEEDKIIDTNGECISLPDSVQETDDDRVIDKTVSSGLETTELKYDSILSNGVSHSNGHGIASNVEEMSLSNESKYDDVNHINSEKDELLDCSNINTKISLESLPHCEIDQLHQGVNGCSENVQLLNSTEHVNSNPGSTLIQSGETKFEEPNNCINSSCYDECNNQSECPSNKDPSLKLNSSNEDSDFYDDEDVLRKITASMNKNVEDISEKDVSHERGSGESFYQAEDKSTTKQEVCSVLNEETKHPLSIITEVSENDSPKIAQVNDNSDAVPRSQSGSEAGGKVEINGQESIANSDCDKNAFKTEVKNTVPIPFSTVVSDEVKLDESVAGRKIDLLIEFNETSEIVLPEASFANEELSHNSTSRKHSQKTDLLENSEFSLEHNKNTLQDAEADSMPENGQVQSQKPLPIPSIIVTNAEDLSSSDDELGDFLAEHLKLYKQEDADISDGFEVTPDYSESPFADAFGYTSGVSTVENDDYVEAVNFTCGNSEHSSFS